MSPTVTPERLIPQLEAWLAKRPRRPVWAIHHEGEWAGPNELTVEGDEVTVRVCPSELAIREALAANAGGDGPLVLLTPVTELATDVLARLAKRRVTRLHAADAVMHLFGVGLLDPRLMGERWLLEALVDSAPPEGYERSGAHELDLDRAWSALLRHRHGFDLDGGLPALVRWAEGTGGESLREAAEAEREGVRRRLSAVLGGATPLLALVLAGRGRDALAFGLVARVLADAPDGAARTASSTRAEIICGGGELERNELRLFAEAAEGLVEGWLAAQDARANDALAAGEQLLAELQAKALAEQSALLRGGLRRRQAVLGEALSDRTSVDSIKAAARLVEEHRLAASEGADLSAALALRLSRWLATEESPAEDFRAATLQHASDSAYADRARLALRDGAGEPGLDAALRRLVAAADARRMREEQRFATLLAQWASNAETGEALLGVEDVLTTIVAPIAEQRPVLFALLDGMSHRVAAELLESLTRAGFTELRREGRPERALGVSTLPSLTSFSRASLFEGTLTRGTATDEAKGFAAQAGLSQVGAAAPRLFHKKAIADEHSGLAEELRAEIAGSRQTVGVVVNAIDDHLARSEQLATRWSIRDVPALRLLLEAARDSGRVVVLASDHGHVIERGSQLRSSAGGGGERWRPAGVPEAGEVVIEGPRVLAPGGRCILAWDERVRYGAKKNGYHGGGSAQEVVTPVLVLAPDLAGGLAGWREAPLDEPAWWVGEEAEPAPAAVETTRPQPEPELGEQLSLERPGKGAPQPQPRPSASAGWVQTLLASEAFASQRATAGRAPLSDERVALILATLDSHGGRLLRDALGRACGIAPLRLTGQLAALRQLLNVDGYPVLEVDEATGDVLLDRELLILQFGLDGS